VNVNVGAELGSEARPIPVWLPSSGSFVQVGKRTFRYLWATKKIQFSDDFGALWKDYVYKSTVYKFQGHFYELVVESEEESNRRKLTGGAIWKNTSDAARGAHMRGVPEFTDTTPLTSSQSYKTSQLPPFVKTFTEISSLPFQPPVVTEEDVADASKRLTPGSGRRRKTLSSFIDSNSEEGTAASSDAGTWSDYWMLAHNGLSTVREPITPPPAVRRFKSPLDAAGAGRDGPDAALNAPIRGHVDRFKELTVSPLGSREGSPAPLVGQNLGDTKANGSVTPPRARPPVAEGDFEKGLSSISRASAGGGTNANSNTELIPENSQQAQMDEERAQWQRWAMYAAEMERNRRISVLREMEVEEQREREERRRWAIEAIEKERQERIQNQFLHSMTSSTWFADTISAFNDEYDIVCPYSHLGCDHICKRSSLEAHIASCKYRNFDAIGARGDLDAVEEDVGESSEDHELICPYSVLGCTQCFPRSKLYEHLNVCRYAGTKRDEREERERERWKGVVVKEAEEERQRRVEEAEEENTENGRRHSAKPSSQLLHSLLQSQIGIGLANLNADVLEFARRSTANSLRLLKARQAVLKGMCNVIQGYWGDDAQALLYGSCATGLDTEDSDVDIVISFTKNNRSLLLDTVTVAHKIHELASHMSTIPWIRIVASVTHGRVPVVKATALVKLDGSGVVPFLDEESRILYETVEIPLDVSIDGPTHSGISSTSFVRSLTSRMSSLRPLVLVLKKLLAVNKLNDPFSGGLSSYGLVLMAMFVLLRKRKLLARATSDVGSSFRSDGVAGEGGGEGGGGERDSAGAYMYTPGRQRSKSEGGSAREVPAPENQATFGTEAGKTILKQAGFLPAIRSGRLGSSEKESPGSDDISVDDFDEDDFYGFTFYIQHREFDFEEEETEGFLGDDGYDESWVDDEDEDEDDDKAYEQYEGHDGDEGDGGVEDGDVEEEAKEEDEVYEEKVKQMGIKVVGNKALPKAVQRSLKWQKKSAKQGSADDGNDILYGQLLMDFFSLWGDDFDINKTGFSVRGGGFIFPLHGDDAPEHPLANDPFIIEDPLNATNNVGRTCYRISMLQRIFSNSLLAVKSGIAGAKERSQNTSILLFSLLTPPTSSLSATPKGSPKGKGGKRGAGADRQESRSSSFQDHAIGIDFKEENSPRNGADGDRGRAWML